MYKKLRTTVLLAFCLLSAHSAIADGVNTTQDSRQPRCTTRRRHTIHSRRITRRRCTTASRYASFGSRYISFTGGMVGTTADITRIMAIMATVTVSTAMDMASTATVMARVIVTGVESRASLSSLLRCVPRIFLPSQGGKSNSRASLSCVAPKCSHDSSEIFTPSPEPISTPESVARNLAQYRIHGARSRSATSASLH